MNFILDQIEYFFNLFFFRGVMAIEHADFDGIERLALVTGGEIVSTFGKPELVKIGKCDLIEQVASLVIHLKMFNMPRSSGLNW